MKTYTMLKGVSVILLITLMISGIPWMAWVGYGLYLHWRAQDPANQIVAIVQKSPDNGILKNGYLAELLDLSYDSAKNLFNFSTNEAQRKLLQSPLIKSASVSKIPPGTIFVEYQARKPVAFLGDVSNTAIDDEGVIFPFKPFFTPKKLPEVFLGVYQMEDEPTLSWGKTISGERLQLALQMLKQVPKEIDGNFKIRKIDLSHIDSSSYGQREIVIILENQIPTVENGGNNSRPLWIYLRLNSENYLNAIRHFRELQKSLIFNEKKQSQVVDLRIPHYAYLQQLRSP